MELLKLTSSELLSQTIWTLFLLLNCGEGA